MKKVCVITGSRAEYGLLYWTMRAILDDPFLQLQVCVTGMHLSPEFGLTYRQIEEDGFSIDSKVEMLLSSDTPVGISKSVGLGMIGFADAFVNLKPDIVLLLGDRFEIFSAAVAAMISKIPVAHCHGGEVTEGVIDESLRHSITKMSQLHFAATNEYRRRIIQLGESPESVHNVGALGVESINKIQLLSQKELEDSIDFKLGKLNFIVTFHPVSLENSTAENQFKQLLKALEGFGHAHIIFTKPNADTDGRIIGQLIDDFVSRNSHRAVAFVSLGQKRYLSVLQFMDVVIGNSSSGLIEVPAFGKPTINIGDRQRGRIKGDSIIDVKPVAEEIENQISYSLSAEFQAKLGTATNPYGNENASEKILPILKNLNIEGILKKRFHNIPLALATM